MELLAGTPLDSGEAIALCLATGAAYNEMTRPHSIASEAREKSKKVVKLRTIRERAMDDDDLGIGSPARPTPLIDQLQQAAWLWSRNLTDRLSLYRGDLSETRWAALRTLGQAVAECLPDGDEDRRIILGLLGTASWQPRRQNSLLHNQRCFRDSSRRGRRMQHVPLPYGIRSAIVYV